MSFCNKKPKSEIYVTLSKHHKQIRRYIKSNLKKTMDINVDKELAQLEPSFQLLQYYRKKVTQFDKEHDDMLNMLHK